MVKNFFICLIIASSVLPLSSFFSQPAHHFITTAPSPSATHHPSAGSFLFFFFLIGFFLFFVRFSKNLPNEIPSHLASFFSFVLSPTTITTLPHPSLNILFVLFCLFYFYFIFIFLFLFLFFLSQNASIPRARSWLPCPLFLASLEELASLCTARSHFHHCWQHLRVPQPRGKFPLVLSLYASTRCLVAPLPLFIIQQYQGGHCNWLRLQEYGSQSSPISVRRIVDALGCFSL